MRHTANQEKKSRIILVERWAWRPSQVKCRFLIVCIRRIWIKRRQGQKGNHWRIREVIRVDWLALLLLKTWEALPSQICFHLKLKWYQVCRRQAWTWSIHFLHTLPAPSHTSREPVVWILMLWSDKLHRPRPLAVMVRLWISLRLMFLQARKASRVRAPSTRDQRSQSSQWCSTASQPQWSQMRRARSPQHTAPCLWIAKAFPVSSRTKTPRAPRALSRTALQLWAMVARQRAITRRRSALANTRATLAESK